MTIIYVQFSDTSETAISSVFGCEQDPDAYPNQGQVEDTDPRYLSFINPNPSPHIPKQISRRQGRLALLEIGKLILVEQLLSSIEGVEEQMKAQIEYEADVWERSNEFLQQMWSELGGTSVELDELFISASGK